MAVSPKSPIRTISTRQDLGSIEAIKYNDATGAGKVIIVEPAIQRTVGASEIVGPGKYVKVTGTSYTLDLLGKAYSAAATYQRGDVVSQGADIYLAMEDSITGVFDASKWRRVAPKQISAIPIVAGSVVTTGRWHNTVTAAGFLVDDDSMIAHIRVRD